jgi:hypothetical protein
MTHTARIVFAAALALVVGGAVVASARHPGAGSTVPEVLVTARGPNAVVDEIVVRPTGGQNLAETTSANTSVN